MLYWYLLSCCVFFILVFIRFLYSFVALNLCSTDLTYKDYGYLLWVSVVSSIIWPITLVGLVIEYYKKDNY